MPMAEASTLVCCGDRLASEDQYASGRGTYAKDGYIYAATVGLQRVTERPVKGEGGETTEQADDAAAPNDGRPVLEVVSSSAQPVVPRQGDVVTVKVTRVSQNTVNCRIVCVGSKALEVDFKGIIRLQDVRATEIDKVVMYECFRPGDVVVAEVLSLGDARSYFLSTAKNELGVVHATSISGCAMVPVGWEQMQDPETLGVEKRKVARVSGAATFIKPEQPK